MSVNLSRTYRVIAVVMIVGVAFSTLAWSGSHRAETAAQPDRDTIPSHHKPRQERKASKPRHRAPEGRVARELDLRIDEEEPSYLTGIDGLDSMDVRLNLEDLKGLNARIEADVLKNADVWKTLEDLRDLEALDELDRLTIHDEDLEELKDLNINEDIWNELHELKIEMDELREELGNQISGKVDDERIQAAVRRVVEAVKMEIPRVRREVEKALAAYRDRDGQQQWQ